MAECWAYAHVDLGEPHLPDGSIVRRPVVTVAPVNSAQILLAVVDSGSPISVADARLFQRLGIDTERDKPLYDVPLTIGGGDGRIPVYAVQLMLVPPGSIAGSPVPWSLHLGARTRWHLPFAVLFGQRGWFDRFPTTIDATTTTVEL